jgi:hypothetical protein
MPTNSQLSEEVLRLYETLQARKETLKEQLAEVEKQFESLSVTMGLLRLPTPGMIGLNLGGKTQLEALIAIARANNNLLIVRQARRLMTKAGLFTNPKNASSVIFTTIGRSGRFKPAGVKGQYILLDPKELSRPLPLPEAVSVAS